MDKNVYTQYLPSSELKPYIKRFMVADCAKPINEVVYPKPTGYSYFNWQIRGRWFGEFGEFGDTFDSQSDELFITGQIEGEEIKVTETGRFCHIVTEFTALGFYQITGLKGDEVINQAIGVAKLDNEFSRQAAVSLRDPVHFSVDHEAVYYLDLLEGFLSERVKSVLTVPDYLKVAVQKLEDSDGMVKIADLHKGLTVSVRQFNRRFKTLIGLTPKTFARVLQMNRVLNAMLSEDHEYLSNIAVEWGYYDESHLIHTIQDFFELPPSRFLKSKQETLFAFLGQSRNR